MTSNSTGPRGRYDDQVVLISGGASGIGRASVAAFAREGAKIVFTDVNADNGASVVKELSDNGIESMFLESDATDEASVAEAIAATVSRHGRLDVAVNVVGAIAAGDSPAFEVHDTPLSGWNNTLTVSLTSCFLSMKHQILQMLDQGRGVIANTTSLAGMRVTNRASPAYSAAKAGVIHLTEYAAIMYAEQNIRVNVVAPGTTSTQVVLDHMSPGRLAVAGAHHPMNRMITPDEIADAFLWVCSSQASGVTGLTIPVDGGWAAR